MDWQECMVEAEVWRGIEGRGAGDDVLDSVRLGRGARAVV